MDIQARIDQEQDRETALTQEAAEHVAAIQRIQQEAQTVIGTHNQALNDLGQATIETRARVALLQEMLEAAPTKRPAK